MNKILVIYKSKYGSTKKYVDMLKAELENRDEGRGKSVCDIVAVEQFDKALLENYNTVIVAGAVYASGISGLNVLKKNWDVMKDKKTAVFCVGASPYDEKAIREVKDNNLKGELKDIPLFYGRGAWDESRMTFKDRTLCRLLQKMVAKQNPEECEPWIKALLSAVGQKCDWTDRKYLLPLFEYIRGK